MWEDDINKRGGRWLISLTPVGRGQKNPEVDNIWTEMVRCLHSFYLYILTTPLEDDPSLASTALVPDINIVLTPGTENNFIINLNDSKSKRIR